MSDEEYRQEGINMQLKPIKDKLDSLEKNFDSHIKSETKIHKDQNEQIAKLKEQNINAKDVIEKALEKLSDKTEKKEKPEKPYLDLGTITSENGELSDYTPSQFVRDYAKNHTLFSLYGLMFPEEDSGGEKEFSLPKRENGLNHSHGKLQGNEPLLNSKLPEPIYQLKFKDIIIDIIDIMGYNKNDEEVKEIKKYLEGIGNTFILKRKLKTDPEKDDFDKGYETGFEDGKDFIKRVRDATRKELIDEFLEDLKNLLGLEGSYIMKKWQGRLK